MLIEGNLIHDLTYEGTGAGAGYGVAMIGGWSDPTRPQRLTNVTIRGNRFSRIPADGIQARDVENMLIEDNEFDHITPFLQPTSVPTGSSYTVRRQM